MNHSAARALANHLSGLYQVVRVERDWLNGDAGWVVRCLHSAGFWVVYTQP